MKTTSLKLLEPIFHQSCHLNETQLLPCNNLCCFCGIQCQNTRCILQKDPVVYLIQCQSCGAIFASRLPIQSALDNYYAQYYLSAKMNAPQERITFDGSRRFGKYLARKTYLYLQKEHLKILDYGGGDGNIAWHVAIELLSKGVQRIDIFVVDYNKIPLNKTHPSISITYVTSPEHLQLQSIDFIIASAIIEHLPNPNIVLLDLLNLLSEQGLFYARTPYNFPFIKLFNSVGLKFDFTFPAHIYDLGQHFWQNFFVGLIPPGFFMILHLGPAIVEASFKEHFFTALISHIFKLPWYLLGKKYDFYGGWEVIARKNNSSLIHSYTPKLEGDEA